MKTCYIDRETRSIVDLSPEHDGLLLNRINVPKTQRGKGNARKLVSQVLADADAERVTLYLWIQPSGGLDFDQLEAWYRRLGFESYREHLYRRLPR